MKAVFTRLFALDLAFQVLNVQILLDLSFILLTLKLCHLFRIFVLFAREIILELFVGSSSLLNLLGQNTLLVFELLVSIRLVHLFFDDAREIENGQVPLHLFNGLFGGLDELSFMLTHLQLVTFHGWLLLQLAAQLLSAVLKLLRNFLFKSNEIRLANTCEQLAI